MLHTGNVPSKLKLPLFREYGKGADEVTLVPWSNGKMLYFKQRIGIELQRTNAASIMSTVKRNGPLG